MRRDWNVICQRTGMKFPRKDLYQEWTGLWVHKDVVNARPQQDYVKSILDDPSVRPVSVAIAQAVGSTTVYLFDVSGWTFSVTLTSVTGLSAGDPIGVVMDNGATHWSFIDSLSSVGYEVLFDVNGEIVYDANGEIVYTADVSTFGTIILGSPISHKASIGNTIYLPSINNEAWT